MCSTQKSLQRSNELAGRIRSEADAQALVDDIAEVLADALPSAWSPGNCGLTSSRRSAGFLVTSVSSPMLIASAARHSAPDSKEIIAKAMIPPAAPQLFEFRGSPARWNRWKVLGLFALVALWAAKFYSTWAGWGNLTIDSGHEMYIPALLAEGRMLYRDVWFMCGPAVPYFYSYLFRWFAEHLKVLDWAASLSALGSAIFLYLAGMRLSRSLLGWTAGAVVLPQASGTRGPTCVFLCTPPALAPGKMGLAPRSL